MSYSAVGSMSSCIEGSVTVVSDVYNSSLQLMEMCSEGVWSSVCDNNWTIKDATVICRELGYTSPGILTPPTVQWSMMVITMNTTFKSEGDIAFSWRYSSYSRDTRLHWN